jgi:hypothetical protein
MPDRRTRLNDLVNVYHRRHYGDYDDMYEDFEQTYLAEDHDESLPIPRYASIAGDETYGKITLFDDINEALADQAATSDNGEYLNVPEGIIDLDTGDEVETVTRTFLKADYDRLRAAFDESSPDDVGRATKIVAIADDMFNRKDNT